MCGIVCVYVCVCSFMYVCVDVCGNGCVCFHLYMHVCVCIMYVLMYVYWIMQLIYISGHLIRTLLSCGCVSWGVFCATKRNCIALIKGQFVEQCRRSPIANPRDSHGLRLECTTLECISN